MIVASPLLDKAGRFLAGLQPSSGGIVVAVSGGPDSVALLRALVLWRQRSAEPRLVVAHLNHGLRGGESDADEAFVRQLHGSLLNDSISGLELSVGRIDVGQQARSEGDNLENTARRLRYDWLKQTAVAFSCRWVATGHTADDQAETVLHRLLRGTGLHGLRGIAHRRPLAEGIDIIRPLLAVSRAEVLAFLTQLGESYREDSSNRNLDLTRNRLRHELLPLLVRDYNPAIGRLLCQLASQAEEFTQAIDSLAQHLLVDAELPRAGRLLIFDRQRLTAAPRNLVREMFRRVWARESWSENGMTYAAWDRLAAVVHNEVSAVDLTGQIRARGQGRVVQVGPVC